MALNRPAATSQARGLSGMPSRGHCSSAARNASESASSARSKSPSRRTSVAKTRRDSVLYSFSISSFTGTEFKDFRRRSSLPRGCRRSMGRHWKGGSHVLRVRAVLEAEARRGGEQKGGGRRAPQEGVPAGQAGGQAEGAAGTGPGLGCAATPQPRTPWRGFCFHRVLYSSPTLYSSLSTIPGSKRTFRREPACFFS